MSKINFTYLLLFLFILGIPIIFGFAGTSEDSKYQTDQSKNNSSEVSNSSFDKMMQVITHQRCMNCHPSGDRPKQGEDRHIHYFDVQRGAENHGVSALQCQTCHQTENNLFSGVPGAPHWGLAPSSMAWEGLTNVEIAKVILDPVKNGGRSLDDIVKHMTEDALVLWAWTPGVSADGSPREKPPVPKEDYIAAVKAWAEAGAIIPE